MKATFRIEFAHWTGNRAGYEHGVSLRIEDAASGESLVDVSLNPEQFTAMMCGGVLSGIEGRLSPHLDRVGKRMENESVKVPREISSHGGYGYGHGDEDEAKVREWAIAQPWASEWETFEPRFTNAGWKIIVRRWVADLAEVAS